MLVAAKKVCFVTGRFCGLLPPCTFNWKHEHFVTWCLLLLSDVAGVPRWCHQVKAVVLRINSPGGSAVASDMIAREVQLLRDAGKPVVACMGDVAASGGYYIAGKHHLQETYWVVPGCCDQLCTQCMRAEVCSKRGEQGIPSRQQESYATLLERLVHQGRAPPARSCLCQSIHGDIHLCSIW